MGQRGIEEEENEYWKKKPELKREVGWVPMEFYLRLNIIIIIDLKRASKHTASFL